MEANELNQAWGPNQNDLQQTVSLLQALRDPTRGDHKLALQALGQSVTNPNTVLHILLVFSRGAAYETIGLSPDIRQLAGLVIKNYAFKHLHNLPPMVQQLVKQEMVAALSDILTDIRNTAAILVGKISESFMIDTWADVIPHLLNMLEYSQHGQLVVVDGALQAVRRMCEDSVEKLSMDTVRRPLDSLLPKLIALLACPDETIRLRALETINSTLFLFSPSSHPTNTTRSNLFPNQNGVTPSSSNNSLSSHGGGSMSQSGGTGMNRCGNVIMSSPPSTSPIMSHRDNNNNSPLTIGSGLGSGNGNAGCGAQALAVNMTSFLQGLSALSADPSPAVRRAVCQALVLLASLQLSVLEPVFASICDFLLQSILDADEGVAMEACEFWFVLSVNNDAHTVVLSHMGVLIRNIISRLTLTPEQIMLERVEEEAQATGEKEINFKPIHRRGGNDGNGRDDVDDEEEASAKWTLRKQAALVLDNLAVTFAAEIVLSHALPVIQQKLQAPSSTPTSTPSQPQPPHPPQYIPGPEDGVWQRESGMLALGALSTGCLIDMGQYLPQLFPFLVQNLADPTPEMRSIACWVLSRYCAWIFEDQQLQAENGASERYFVQMLEGLILLMVDPRPKVQSACCSALCTLFEAAGSDPIIPFLPQIFAQVQRAFGGYGVKSSLILIDMIGTLADTTGDALCDPVLIPLFLPTLMTKFGELEDYDMRMFPVMECLMSVVAVLGLEIQPYAQSLYYRCVRIIGNTVTANTQADAKAKAIQMARLHKGVADDPTSITSRSSDSMVTNIVGQGSSTTHRTLEGGLGLGQVGGDAEEEEEPPSKDFAICALDVVAALCEALEGNFAVLADQTKDMLLQLTFTCLQDDLPELRQSAFAFTGDLCKHCATSFLNPVTLPQLMELVLRSMIDRVDGLGGGATGPGFGQDWTPSRWHPTVCNNAVWTVGELAIKVGGDVMSPYVTRLMQALMHLLHDGHIQCHGGGGSANHHHHHGHNHGETLTMWQPLLENVAITIGRLGLTNTTQLATFLPDFLEKWCLALQLTRTFPDKTHAFGGLVALINANPQALLTPTSTMDSSSSSSSSSSTANGNKGMDGGSSSGTSAVRIAHAFFLACSSWVDPPEDPQLLQQLSQMLHALKNHNTSGWNAVLAVTDRDVRHHTLDTFRV